MGCKTVLKRLLTKYAPKSIEMQQMAMFDQSVVNGSIENMDEATPNYADNVTTNVEEVTEFEEVQEPTSVVESETKEPKKVEEIKVEPKKEEAKEVKIFPEGGVRYTVPATIRPTEMDDTLTVRFRVADVYKNRAIVTYFDNVEISRRKRPVMAPGEMEQVILTKAKLAEFPDLSRITITLEEA